MKVKPGFFSNETMLEMRPDDSYLDQSCSIIKKRTKRVLTPDDDPMTIKDSTQVSQGVVSTSLQKTDLIYLKKVLSPTMKSHMPSMIAKEDQDKEYSKRGPKIGATQQLHSFRNQCFMSNIQPSQADIVAS